MLVVLLPILPCLLAAPIVVIFVGIVLPLWFAALLLSGGAWLLVAPLEFLVRLAGGGWLQSSRTAIERALHHLTHPTIPARFRKRG